MLHNPHHRVCSFSQPMLRLDFVSLFQKTGLEHVAENILSYLDAKSLCAAELVCKEWYEVISESMLWKNLIERRVRIDSLWKKLGERRGWIKYLFKPSPGEPHPDHMFYRCLYPNIIQDIENIQANWRCGRYTLKRIICQSANSEGACCVQYDDHKIVSGLSDNTIKIWDRTTLECIQVLTGHSGPVVCLQYDDRFIISGSSDSTVRFWDVETGELINTSIPESGACFHLRFNNGMMITCSKDPFTAIWTLYNRVSPSKITFQRVLVDAQGIAGSVSDFGEKYIIFPPGNKTIEVRNETNLEVVRTLEGHKQGVTCLQYCDRLVVSGSTDKTIRLWDVESGTCLRTLKGHKDFVTCIQFDNRRIVSGANDGEIKVWDLAAALDPRAPAKTICLRTLVEHTGSVSTLQFDEFQIVSSSSDDTILIWDFLNVTRPETPAINIRNIFKYCFPFCCRKSS